MKMKTQRLGSKSAVKQGSVTSNTAPQRFEFVSSGLKTLELDGLCQFLSVIHRCRAYNQASPPPAESVIQEAQLPR